MPGTSATPLQKASHVVQTHILLCSITSFMLLGVVSSAAQPAAPKDCLPVLAKDYYSYNPHPLRSSAIPHRWT